MWLRLNPRRKSQYELQFKKWKFRKNCTAAEWKIIAHKVKERKEGRKESEVLLHGNLINPKKLRKETLRYGSLSEPSNFLPSGGQSISMPKLDSHNNNRSIATYSWWPDYSHSATRVYHTNITVHKIRMRSLATKTWHVLARMSSILSIRFRILSCK